MAPPTSDKTGGRRPGSGPARELMRAALRGLLVVLTLHVVSCDDGRTTGGDLGASRDRGRLGDGVVQPLDFGENWLEAGTSRGGDTAGAADPVWGVILMTFVDDGHDLAAATMKRELVRIDPRLGEAWTHTDERGSMVAFGRYAGPQDPDARRDLGWIRGLRRGNLPVFRKAMLGRVVEGRAAVSSPWSLRKVRERFPDMRPLYTLQVAIWGQFDSALRPEELQQKAEAYARELRARRVEAYVHHDLDRKLSHVTVGLFGADAIDPESNLYSAEVEYMMRQFPRHLVNGEPLHEPVNPLRPSRGTQPQRPRLVEVP